MNPHAEVGELSSILSTCENGAGWLNTLKLKLTVIHHLQYISLFLEKDTIRARLLIKNQTLNSFLYFKFKKKRRKKLASKGQTFLTQTWISIWVDEPSQSPPLAVACCNGWLPYLLSIKMRNYYCGYFVILGDCMSPTKTPLNMSTSAWITHLSLLLSYIFLLHHPQPSSRLRAHHAGHPTHFRNVDNVWLFQWVFISVLNYKTAAGRRTHN